MKSKHKLMKRIFESQGMQVDFDSLSVNEESPEPIDLGSAPSLEVPDGLKPQSWPRKFHGIGDKNFDPMDAAEWLIGKASLPNDTTPAGGHGFFDPLQNFVLGKSLKNFGGPEWRYHRSVTPGGNHFDLHSIYSNGLDTIYNTKSNHSWGEVGNYIRQAGIDKDMGKSELRTYFRDTLKKLHSEYKKFETHGDATASVGKLHEIKIRIASVLKQMMLILAQDMLFAKMEFEKRKR